MFHLGAFYESVDPAAALTIISAVSDQSVTTNGNDLIVPSQVPQLLAEAALTAATGPGYGQVQSPSLRQLANQDVLPIAVAAVFANENQISWHADNPRMLEAAEALNFAIEATGGVAAANYGLVWLGDGPLQTTRGKIFSIRATAAASLVAGTWVNAALTFDTTLPAGSYQVVGMRAQSANLVAARINFIGQAFRPGVIGNTSGATNLMPYARNGQMGVFGQFNSTTPPTIDFLGATDTAEVIVLDLIKVK